MATATKTPVRKRQTAKRKPVRKAAPAATKRRRSKREPAPREPVERQGSGHDASPDADRPFQLPREERPDVEPSVEGQPAVANPDVDDWDDDEPTTPWRVGLTKKQPLAEPAR